MPVCNGQVDFIVALVFNFYYCIMTDAERRRPVEHYCCEDKGINLIIQHVMKYF